jgi:hypothetical protein
MVTAAASAAVVPIQVMIAAAVIVGEVVTELLVGLLATAVGLTLCRFIGVGVIRFVCAQDNIVYERDMCFEIFIGFGAVIITGAMLALSYAMGGMIMKELK